MPDLTLLPSYWNENKNRVTLVDRDGGIIEYQEKHIPFVNIREGITEALDELDEWVTVVVHIPGMHRIAVMICAEFLAMEPRDLKRFICGELATTLIIVPSYSHGEQDFINLLMSLKGYGTTVVWGNCCGAVKGEEKAIGGCGVAGMSEIKVFGNECKCGNSCDQIEACVFKVKLPLSYALSKTKSSKCEEIVTHEIRRKNEEKGDLL